MDEYTIRVSVPDKITAAKVIKSISGYDCQFTMEKNDETEKYPLSNIDAVYSRLSEPNALVLPANVDEVQFYRNVTGIIERFGISPKHKGFMYSIECVKLIMAYGMKDYKMDIDIYPVVSEIYDVSANSVEHNIRNAITQAWCNYNSKDAHTDMGVFTKRPTNIRFLKYIASITTYSLL